MLIHCERKITKEQYERGMENHRFMTEADLREVFSAAELFGYGVYTPVVFERDGEYYVGYTIGDSCD